MEKAINRKARDGWSTPRPANRKRAIENIALFHHRKQSVQNADNCAARTVAAFGETSQSVKVTEELVSPVEEMRHHLD